MATPICFKLLTQLTRKAFSLDFDSVGNSSAARMAMIAITTSSSINVNPCWIRQHGPDLVAGVVTGRWDDGDGQGLVIEFIMAMAGSLLLMPL